MKKVFFSLVFLLCNVACAQTFPVNNLQVNGNATINSLPAHNLTVGQGTSPLTGIPPGTTNFGLVSNGASADPSFQQLTSALSTYTAPATGGTARTQSAKNGDTVSVKDYGAVGNGVANDTTAIKNAIVAACGVGGGGAFGGKVYLPAGNYLVTTGSVTITQGNCYIEGDGIDATIITPSGTTGNVFSFTASQNQGISGLQITYATPPTSGAAISVSSGNIFVHNVTLNGVFQGINTSGGGSVFEKIYIQGVVATTGVGMVFTGGGQANTVRDVIINNQAGLQPAAGILITNQGGLTLDNVDVIHSGTGLNILPTNPTDVVQWLFAVNSQFDTNSGNGISIQTTNAGQEVVGLNFVNCWSSSNTVQGVLIAGTAGTIDGVRFVGHRAFNNGQNGIVLNYGANLSVNDSDVSGNSQSASNTYHGIQVSTSSFILTNNRVGQEAGFGNTQHFGILVNAGAFNFYIIQGNNTQGNNAAGVQDGGTGGTKSVTGNI